MNSLAQNQKQVKMNLQTLFPISIGLFDYEKSFSEEELNFFLDLKQRANEGNTSSAETNVLSRPEMKNIKEFVFGCVDSYFNEIYRPFFNVKQCVTQSWANYTNKNQYHHKHQHSNSFLSGIFYIQTCDEDRVTFYKTHDQSLRVTPKEYTPYNSESWWFEARKGMLLLFPSNLEHMVEVKNTDGTRISLSFNTFPVGVLGDRVALNEAIITGLTNDE